QPRYLVDRLLRRREADPLERLFRQRVEPLEREGEMRTALVARERVDLVDDGGLGAAENSPAVLRREQDVKRLRRRNEDVRRPADHRLALGRGRVARPDGDANLRKLQKKPLRFGELHDAGERDTEILLDVVAERLQRRHVDDAGAVLEAASESALDEPIDRPEKGGERLARAGGGSDQRRPTFRDVRPACSLCGGWAGAKVFGKPAPDQRMKRDFSHANGMKKTVIPF